MGDVQRSGAAFFSTFFLSSPGLPEDLCKMASSPSASEAKRVQGKSTGVFGTGGVGHVGPDVFFNVSSLTVTLALSKGRSGTCTWAPWSQGAGGAGTGEAFKRGAGACGTGCGAGACSMEVAQPKRCCISFHAGAVASFEGRPSNTGAGGAGDEAPRFNGTCEACGCG